MSPRMREISQARTALKTSFVNCCAVRAETRSLHMDVKLKIELLSDQIAKLVLGLQKYL